jgi:chromosome segregation ATPase
MTDKIILAETKPDPNNFLKIVEVNPPKTMNMADSPQSGGPTTPSLALGLTKETGLEKSNQSRIHICDVVNELNKDIATLKSSVSGIVAQIRTAIQALFATLASNPFTEDIKQQISSLKAEAALIEKDIRIHLNEIQAVQKYISYLKTLIYTIEHSSEEVRKLLQSCLTQANSDLATYNARLQALNNTTSLNEKQNLLNTTNQNLANTAQE